MSIRNNISALNTQRNLAGTNRSLSKSLEKLSSGFRINVGADGPADLIISEQLRAQNVGLQRAVRNTQEAINVIGIAEGALNEMNSILKQMRSLALASANSGITSPIQVAANQSEVDSGIQTIDRIANTTKFSDQFLLNGSKGIVFSSSTDTVNTQQNKLINANETRLDQIFKRDGFNIGVTFTGTTGTVSLTGAQSYKADISQSAQKAYFEINPAATNAGDVNATGDLTSATSFILTGNQGSRSFNFNTGTNVSQIASAINNVSDSTGVDANLIFGSGTDALQHSATLTSAAAISVGGAGARTAGTIQVFNNRDAAGALIATTVTGSVTGAVLGYNTDGNGRMFLKVTGNTTYELYKDSSLSQESLIATGVSGTALVAGNAENSSGVAGLNITLAAGNVGEVLTLGIDGIEGADTGTGITFSGSSFSVAGGANSFQTTTSFLNGIELGKNTDDTGKIFFRTVMDTATTGQVFAYKDSRLRNEDIVAQSTAAVNLAANRTIILDEVRNTDDTAGTGLNIALNTVTGFAGFTAGDTIEGDISFTNLGVRISSGEYGSDSFVRIQQQSGAVFQQYQQKDSATPTLVDAGTSGVTVQENGADATLVINGQKIETDGLTARVATSDLQGDFVFNEGSVGSTTIAQVGYTEGSIYTQATQLTDVNVAFTVGAALNTRTTLGGFLANTASVTDELIDGFSNGMQLQLGEGAGDQERTVLGIQSVAVSNLGRTQFTGNFEPANAVIETKTLSLADVLGGGLASLSTDPVKALAIVDQAISDVSNLRARLGATQSNLLQTTANSLQVAIENITKTESAIRDADIAVETTDFTKNQILVQAGTAMLAQANVASQNVLQLLG